MDRNQFAELLNQDLETEYQSIVQYIQHVATVTGAEYMNVIDELRQHLTQELSHATTLAEQVSFLNAVPTTRVPVIAAQTETKAALRADLDLESTQLDRYRERVKQAEELGLIDVAEALRPLLTQTQEHVRDLQPRWGTNAVEPPSR